MKVDPKLLAAIDNYIEVVKSDYAKWHSAIDAPGEEVAGIKEEMIRDFNESIYYDVGNKYVKLIIDGGAHSFIVKDEKDAKFSYGDILKVASWKTPARNYKRGNVFALDNSSVRWTGAQ